MKTKEPLSPATIGQMAKVIRRQLEENYPTCISCGKPCVNVCPGCKGPIHLECIYKHSDGCGGPQ